MERWMSFIGIFTLVAIAWSLSDARRHIDRRLVFWGLTLQFVFALLILGIPAIGFSGPFQGLFALANDAVMAFLNFTSHGVRFIFGDLGEPSKLGFIFAFQILPTIIFFSSIMAVMYHLGVMQKVIKGIALVMHKFMRVSGAEALAASAEIFVGQTESPLMIKPYIKTLTRSELFSVMVGGMATVAGGVLAAYVGLLHKRIPDIAGHLLTASVMASPAALVIAKIMLPERDQPETLGRVPDDKNKIDTNVIEAAARGAGEGLHLALNVGTMLLAFVALVAMLNAFFGWAGELISFSSWGRDLVPTAFQTAEGTRLSMQVILGWMFAPIAWIMGVPTHEITTVGALLGEKIVLNEFMAYQSLANLGSQLSDRSILIASYALCGFANFSSIAIQLGGTGSMAPERRGEIAQLGIRAMIGGSLASFLTAAIAGLLI